MKERPAEVERSPDRANAEPAAGKAPFLRCSWIFGPLKPTFLIRNAIFRGELQASRPCPEHGWMLEAEKPRRGDPPAESCRL